MESTGKVGISCVSVLKLRLSSYISIKEI